MYKQKIDMKIQQLHEDFEVSKNILNQESQRKVES